MIILAILQITLLTALIFALVWSYRASLQPREIYIVSLSSGVSSAVAADRAIKRYGAGNVVNVFMDTRWEDEDNYRFLHECDQRWGIGYVTLSLNMTPLEVFEREKIIPNSFQAPCTRTLKIRPFMAYCQKWQRAGYGVTVILGMDWKERHRMEAPTRNYGARGITVEYPLTWEPMIGNSFDAVREWGIELPRMYKMGYTHANCGGRCVKQGMGEWVRTLIHFPERFHEMQDWEDSAREWRGDHAMLKRGKRPYTLKQLEQDQQTKTPLPLFNGVFDDTTFCFCNAGDPGPLDCA